ncbi:hypothetical protein [Streptomyces sp. NRRL S-4]|uniref:hypothetical protein n=1 Tax=Streptomyces sp. NRRL S-4 TaxID=1519471 RepID=UPI0006B5140B|nr:hypothetical protein [Streptomyces sp. NRRL S-4]KPC78932.1 hypothetical protein ADK82_28475 [Streptomyces sp. NRRL S-4]
MSVNWAGLLIAIVGVGGTLGAALLTQNRADRTKRMELQAAAEQRREERGHAEALLQAEQARQWQSESLERRRACYIALNTASRQYLTEMTNYLYAVQGSHDVDTALKNLEASRLTFRDSYAEAQMVLPDAVLRGAGSVKGRLNSAYGTLRKYGGEPTAYTVELAGMEAELHESVWPYLGELKQSMRADLGIDD